MMQKWQKKTGLDIVGSDDLVESIKKGEINLINVFQLLKYGKG